MVYILCTAGNEVAIFMNGFTDYTFNGKPVFMRGNYEDANAGRSEQDRLGDLIGIYYDDINMAIAYADRTGHGDLLYRRVDEQTDVLLRGYEDWERCWIPFISGYVHKVTGEYVEGEKPMRDSYPCWCLSVPNRYCTTNELTKNAIGEGLSNMAYGILTLIALFNSNDTEE